MSTIAKLLVALGLDSSEYSSGIANVERQTHGLASTLQNASSVALGVVGALSSIAVASGAFDFVKSSALDMNASLEKSTLQFTTLMGDSDKAAQHVRGLFNFAAKTPFETGPIIEASRIMATFGGSALDTTKNLTLFGDAAAATSAPINEVTFWMSRAYAAIQGGQPFGEARMRLMELGILTPQVAAHLEAMSNAGAKSSTQWDVLTGALGKFNGAMALQANTWEGLTSSLSDNAHIAIATAFEPLFEHGKQTLTSILQWINDLSQSGALQVFASKLEVVLGYMDFFGTVLVDYAKDAYNWGSNIVNQFADGLSSAIDLISQVITEIGDILSYWLEPGSPPKVAPKLDQWGKDAATVYFNSWKHGDMSAFGTLQDTIAKNLVGGNTLNIATVFSDLANSTKSAADAQDVLNAATQYYDNLLAPLNAQLRALQDHDQDLKDTKRLAYLNKIVSNVKLTAAQKEAAQSKIAQIILQRQIRGIQEQRDSVLSVAKAHADAAKTAENTQKRADTAVKAAKKNAALNAPMPAGITSKPGAATPNTALSGIQKGFDEAKAKFGAFTSDLQGRFQTVSNFITNFDLGAAINNAISKINVGALAAMLGATFNAWWQQADPLALNAMGNFFSSLWNWIIQAGSDLVTGFMPWANAFVAWIPGATITFLAKWPDMLNDFLDWIAESSVSLLKQLGLWAISFVTWIVPLIPNILIGLGVMSVAVFAWIIETNTVIIGKMVQWAWAMLMWIDHELLPRLPMMLQKFYGAIIDGILFLVGLVSPEAAKIGHSIVDGMWNGITEKWAQFLNGLKLMINDLPAPIQFALGIGGYDTSGLTSLGDVNTSNTAWDDALARAKQPATVNPSASYAQGITSGDLHVHVDVDGDNIATHIQPKIIDGIRGGIQNARMAHGIQ